MQEATELCRERNKPDRGAVDETAEAARPAAMRRGEPLRRALALALLLPFGLAAPAAGAQAAVILDFETIALSGQTAPGTGQTFTAFGSPALNDAGQTAFFASTTSAGGNDQGIFSEGSGTLGLVAFEGGTAPGTGQTFTGFAAPLLNAAGQTSFRA